MTTDAQLESFSYAPNAEEEALKAISAAAHLGATVDEAYCAARPGIGQEHGPVDTFRVAIRKLRERGLVKDSGDMRTSTFTGRSQTVWVLGDDRDVVEAHRRAKLRKFPTSWLRDELKEREEKRTKWRRIT